MSIHKAAVAASLMLLMTGAPAFAENFLVHIHTGPNDPTAVGYVSLERRHPDAVDGIEEFTSYSAHRGLQGLAPLRGFLDSFGQLTELARRGWQTPGCAAWTIRAWIGTYAE